MPRQRTTPILVLAILHLVGGGLGLLLSLCGCGGLLLSGAMGSVQQPTSAVRPSQVAPPPNAGQITQYYKDNVPGYSAFTFGSLGFGILLDGLLIAAGVGLLSVRPWARWLSLIYAPLSILYHIATFFYQLLLVMPATDKLFSQNPALVGMSSILSVSSGIGLFVGLLFTIYPITVIIILLLPSTAATFAGATSIPVADALQEDPDEDDPWRQPPSDKIRPK